MSNDSPFPEQQEKGGKTLLLPPSFSLSPLFHVGRCYVCTYIIAPTFSSTTHWRNSKHKHWLLRRRYVFRPNYTVTRPIIHLIFPFLKKKNPENSIARAPSCLFELWAEKASRLDTAGKYETRRANNRMLWNRMYTMAAAAVVVAVPACRKRLEWGDKRIRFRPLKTPLSFASFHLFFCEMQKQDAKKGVEQWRPRLSYPSSSSFFFSSEMAK